MAGGKRDVERTMNYFWSLRYVNSARTEKSREYIAFILALFTRRKVISRESTIFHERRALAENGISMIADKVNQAPNVIIAEIKKKLGEGGGGGGDWKSSTHRKSQCVIANCAILLNKLNDLMTYAHTGAIVAILV